MFKKDFMTLFRSGKVRIAFIFLLVMMALGVAVSGGEEETSPAVRIGIADNDNSEYSRMLIGFFGQNEVFTSFVSIVTGTDSELEEMFYSGDIDMLLSIPENFAASLINFTNTPMKALINSADETKAVLFKNLLEAYENYIVKVQIGCETLYQVMKAEEMDRELINQKNIEISYDLIFTALGKDKFFERTELERLKSIPLTRYYMYSFLFIIVLYGGLFAGLNLLNEHKIGALARLKSTGLSMRSIIFQKYLFFILLYGVPAIYTIFVFQTTAFIMTVLFTAACIGVFFIIATLVGKTQVYMLISNLLVLIFTIIGGGIIPIMYMPQNLSAFAYFTPNYWFLRIMLSIENGSGSISLPILAASIITFVVVAYVIVVTGCRRREGRAYAGT